MIWTSSWIGGCAVVALNVNTVLTIVGRPTLADAAVEIDRRFALRERLSSVLVLSERTRRLTSVKLLWPMRSDGPEKLDVRDRFTGASAAHCWCPLCLDFWLALFGLHLTMQHLKSLRARRAKSLFNKSRNSTKPLLEQIKKKREEAEKQGLSDIDIDFFKKLEGELAKIQKDNKLDTKQSLAKLNDIKEQLEERRNEMGKRREPETQPRELGKV